MPFSLGVMLVISTLAPGSPALAAGVVAPAGRTSAANSTAGTAGTTVTAAEIMKARLSVTQRLAAAQRAAAKGVISATAAQAAAVERGVKIKGVVGAVAGVSAASLAAANADAVKVSSSKLTARTLGARAVTTAAASTLSAAAAGQLSPGATPDYFGAVPNYANSPLPVGLATVAFTGPGTGAAATATVTNGVLTGVVVTNPGTGYTSAPTVTIGGRGTAATATAAISGTVSAVTVSTGGVGYAAPVVSIVGDGIGATATAAMDATGAITAVTVTNGGTGYTTATATVADSAAGIGAGAVLTTELGVGVSAVTVGAGGTGYLAGGIRKFVDSLPGLGVAGKNNLGNYLTVGHPDTISYPGADYYEIGLREYSQQLASDLPATTLRGYVQLNNGTDAAGANTVVPDPIMFLGPTIAATKGRPVRVKFVNLLPTGHGCDRTVTAPGGLGCGDLFLPVDTTMMGAGTGPKGGTELYTSNRATLHLHGGATPWISDGTPHQWLTPAGEKTSYPKGVSVENVPDMWFDATGAAVAKGTPGATNDPGPGRMTFFYTNAQSARMMFVHDHSYGITRLNVYAGEAMPYLLTDPTEQAMIAAGTVPAEQIPLVVQDKTFVPSDAQLATEDPTWNKKSWGGLGSLWAPHVYVPNQNPGDISGANAMGRWDYGPWFWPPYTALAHGPVANPLAAQPGEPPLNPGVPDNSSTMEAFMDTPVVNGAVYPYKVVAPKAYRLRILNASDDRSLNLSLYYATSNGTMWNADGTLNDANAGEVPMMEATKSNATAHCTAAQIAVWPTDGRDSGVPDCKAAGPALLQIGNEGGLLPAVAQIDPTPVNFDYNRKSITVLNVTTHGLLLAPAERADVVVDFSNVPAGSKLVLYNDAPAANPAFDPRYDYFTGNADLTSIGGAPSTQPGYGPNTRTIMQFRVEGAAAAPFDTAKLIAALPKAYAGSQNPPIVPQAVYNGTGLTSTTTSNYVRIQDTKLTFTPIGATAAITMPLQPKAIQELFEVSYGRMNATGGVELPNTSATIQTTLPMGYAEPATEEINPSDLGTPIGSLTDGTQIWKFTHNGVDVHPIHFHLFDVQLLNRVGWDGAIKVPDANELGWKETVRMNPLEDTIVALRAVIPPIPFKVPDSIRPIDPTMDPMMMINSFDPLTGQAIQVMNMPTNFGWEYVWHCHMLSHEEMDFMRPVVFQVSPAAPTGLAVSGIAAGATPSITTSWTNWATAVNPALTNFTLQRATDAGFTKNVVDLSVPATSATTATWVDRTALNGPLYYYRVRAESAQGYSVWSTSTPAATVLPAPSGLSAAVSATAPLAANLSWLNGPTFATGLTVQRATNAAFTAGLTTVNLTGTPAGYADRTVRVAGTYSYRVRSSLGGMVSVWSAVATLRVVVPATPVIRSVVAARVSATVSWSHTPPVGGFTLQVSSSAVFAAARTQTLTLPATPLVSTVGGLTPNTLYYVRVRASNGAGASGWSGTALGRTAR